jgi:hypothetical protein
MTDRQQDEALKRLLELRTRRLEVAELRVRRSERILTEATKEEVGAHYRSSQARQESLNRMELADSLLIKGRAAGQSAIRDWKDARYRARASADGPRSEAEKATAIRFEKSIELNGLRSLRRGTAMAVERLKQLIHSIQEVEK